MSKFAIFSFGLILAIFMVKYSKLSTDKKKCEIKAKIVEKRLILCESKYRELLTYENDNFKKRVEKFCPCITKTK